MPVNILGGVNLLGIIGVGTDGATPNTAIDIGILENLPVGVIVGGVASLLNPEGNLLNVDAGLNLQLGTGVGDLIGGLLGDDILTGGPGADRFVFAGPIAGQNSGAERNTDFNAGEGDRIVLNGQGVGILGEAGGSVVLQLSSGGTVTLDGIVAGSVQDGWFA